MKAEFDRQDFGDNLPNEVTSAYLRRFSHTKLMDLKHQKEIGEALINNYGDITKVAKMFGISPPTLRLLIRDEPLLYAYYEVAFDGIKQLVDSKMLERVRNDDEAAQNMVFNKLYSGRARGGYNPSEFGGLGFGDKLSDEQAEVANKSGSDTGQPVFKIILERKGEDVDGEYIDATDIITFGDQVENTSTSEE